MADLARATTDEPGWVLRTVAMTWVAGGTVLALALAAKLPPAPGAFPDTWAASAAATGCLLVGALLWRFAVLHAGRRASTDTLRADMRSTAKRRADPWPSLGKLAHRTRQVLDTLGADPETLKAQIDRLLLEEVLPIVESRRQLVVRLGAGRASQVLIQVAVAERMLRRAWSAASDGYLAEATRSVSEAAEAFADAARTAGIDGATSDENPL